VVKTIDEELLVNEMPDELNTLDSQLAPMELLLEADPAVEKIKHYLKKGTCYAFKRNGKIIAACVLNNLWCKQTEIKNISVKKEFRNKGIGKALIKSVINKCKEDRIKKIVLGTGNSSINQIAFYQKCGFRIKTVWKDFFLKNYKEKIMENGIQCVDMIRFEMKISRRK
jgi:N-acetylglutamate synthase-like GNAT family acetyltransferase